MLYLFAPWHRKSRETSSVKTTEKFERKSWSNVPPKLVPISSLERTPIQTFLQFVTLTPPPCINQCARFFCSLLLETLAIRDSNRVGESKILLIQTQIGSYTKGGCKIGLLRKFNRSSEIEFNFLTAWAIPWSLAHLFSMLIFAQDLVMVF